MDIIDYDITYNKLFRLGYCIIKQKSGVSQGGYISLELACLYAETKEDEAYKSNSSFRSPIISRFRDNINILANLDDPIWEDTETKLYNIYNLPLKLEHSIHTPLLGNT